MTTEKPRTIVEILDSTKHDILHKAGKVRINGAEVLVEAGSVNLTFGEHEITKVTLTLLPTEVHFIHDAPAPAGEGEIMLDGPEPLKVGDRVRIRPNPQFHSPFGVEQHPRSHELDNQGGVIKDVADVRGNVSVRVPNISAYSNFMILPEYLDKVTDPEPLKVGDTVLVPKGATYKYGREDRRGVSLIPTPCEAEIVELSSKQGNLTLSLNGVGRYNVHPDQVTKVQP